MFTRKTMHNNEYCHPNDNIKLPQNFLNEPTLALLMGISNEEGVEQSMVVQKAFDARSFIKYIELVVKKHRNQKIALFMDNLGVHHARTVKPVYEKFDVMSIYNAAYSPEFNPIEMCFSKIKHIFKKLRLQKLTGQHKMSHHEMIAQAQASLTLDHVQGCIRHAKEDLDKES